MTFNLNGISTTFEFNNMGVAPDTDAPYINTGAAAALTLEVVFSTGVITESAGAINQGGGGAISLNLEGAGQFDFLGANTSTGTATISRLKGLRRRERAL